MSNTVTGNAQTTIAETPEQTIQRLMAELAASKANAAKPKKETFPLGNGLSCAVSDKGAISIYGLGRFPVTLYRHQLERLFPVIAQLNSFIMANASKLSVKPAVVK
jgi:hypothetical protein